MHSHHAHTEGSPSASAIPGDPVSSARALLAQEEQRRMEECAAEIQEVLARHGMKLEVSPVQIGLVPLAP